MLSVNPYLNFDGKTEDAFNFYKSVFGGEFAMLMRFNEMPGEAGPVAAAEANRIMHVSLPLGKGNILMGSDTSPSMGHTLVEGNNFSISLSTESQAEADKLFGALSSGGKATMPMAKMFWGSYFGMLVDKYGVQWMISYDESRQPS